MDLNKSKMKNIKDQRELEPDFPGVATPQSSELIICIISYTYNPSTAAWGEVMTNFFMRWSAQSISNNIALPQNRGLTL